MRAKALLWRIVEQGPVDLGAAEYRALRRLGFSRADVRRAIDYLLNVEMVEIAAGRNGAVWLRATKRAVA